MTAKSAVDVEAAQRHITTRVSRHWRSCPFHASGTQILNDVRIVAETFYFTASLSQLWVILMARI